MWYLKREEGERVKGESALRNMMPYLLPRRNDSVVYFEQQVDVTHVLKYLAERPELTFFHVVLTAIVRAVYQWPKMNRFVSGGKLYQRDKVFLSFVVKKKMHAEAGMTAVKRQFEKTDTIFDVAKKVNEQIHEGRAHRKTVSEKEMGLITMLPGFMIRFIFWLQRVLDGLNWLPSSMIRNDPLCTSVFMANLGSIGLPAPYHHLFEYGTTSLFGTIGKISKMPVVDENGQVVVRDIAMMRWSFDERIADGFYAAQGLAVFEKYMRDPSALETEMAP